jgi:hypothetical protein
MKMALAALLQADPRVTKVASQIRAQQKIVAPKGIVIPDEYIDDMARAFVQNFGISDVLDMSSTWIVEVKQELTESGGTYEETKYFFTRKGQPLAADFSNAIGYAYPYGQDGSDGTAYIDLSNDRRFHYIFKWNPKIGVPIFAIIPYKEQSFWSGFAPFAGIVAAFIGLPGLIGEAALGAEYAAANPILADAFGKASFQLAMTGGDLEKSLIGAISSVGGAEVGDFVNSSVDSVVIGNVAKAATSAAIQGKDVNKAAIRAAFLGGSKMDTEVLPEDFGLTYEDLFSAWNRIEDENIFDTLGYSADALFATGEGDVYSVIGELAAPSDVTYASGYYPDDYGNIRDINNRIVVSATDAANKTSDEIYQQITDDLQLNSGKVVNSEDAPSGRPATLPPTTKQTKVPSITDQAKTADQLLKTATSIKNSLNVLKTGKQLPYATNPYGTIRPPIPGVPVMRADGSSVVNNGNGTQTIRYPDGRVTTTSAAYSASSGLIPGINNQTLLIGGAILVGALLLTQRK